MHASGKEGIDCRDLTRHPKRLTHGSIVEKVGMAPLLRVSPLFVALMKTF
jgi:hypothetical protein